MIKNLKLLLSVRSWLKSRTLNLSALLGAFVAADLSTSNDLLMTIVSTVAGMGGVTTGTALAILVAIRELVSAVLRAKTDRALDEK